ncbi:unnamed protein product [Linum tenue]|uniref:Uncharacterized protein n=1 Tax=Linum tenue TaxID=586396 RepID=A0AAV0NK91_9ROSI|nr:unnamed protein product [Linum tenue]
MKSTPFLLLLVLLFTAGKQLTGVDADTALKFFFKATIPTNKSCLKVPSAPCQCHDECWQQFGFGSIGQCHFKLPKSCNCYLPCGV